MFTTEAEENGRDRHLVSSQIAALSREELLKLVRAAHRQIGIAAWGSHIEYLDRTELIRLLHLARHASRNRFTETTTSINSNRMKATSPK